MHRIYKAENIIAFVLFVSLSVSSIFAGNKDSLLNIVQTSSDDSTTILTFRELAYYHLFEEYDLEQSLDYINKGVEVGKSVGEHLYTGKMLALKGYVEQYYSNDFARSIESYYSALDEYDLIENDKEKLAIYINLGGLYHSYEQYDDALKFTKLAIDIAEKYEIKSDLALSRFNIGTIYSEIGDEENALKNFEIAKELYSSEEDSISISILDFSIANIVFSKDNISMKDRVEATETYLRVSKVFKEHSLNEFYIGSIVNLGSQLTRMGNYIDAKEYLLEGRELAVETNNYRLLIDVYTNLAENSEKQKNYKDQVVFLKKMNEYNDSLFNENKAKAISETEIKYETDKINAHNELLQKEGEIKDLELTASKAEAKAQEQQKYYLFGGLGLVALFGLFMFNRFRVTNKQKNIIDAQKTVVEKQKAEVESQKVELESTHQQLAEHHKEISDSINYAKRIQEAIMPSMEAMDTALKDGFVLYLPKDVVAGDFFWMEKIEDTVYYAAADCTGHGVPGAMVSVVCSNALNKALLEEGIREPAKLLDRTREIVIKRLAKSGEDVKDGMDISLCVLNMGTKKLKWAGANNPLWILRKDGEEIEEIKADKQPIGVYHQPTPFTSHELSLNEGDTIYVFTDGYQDQFGGPKGKKFKAKQLKDIIISNKNKSMDQQLEELKERFNTWKGDIEQVDDVCLIGVRI